MLARAVFGVLVLVLLVIVLLVIVVLVLVIVAGLPVAAFVIAILIILCGLLVVPLIALVVVSPDSRGCGSAKASDVGRLVRKSNGGSPAKTEVDKRAVAPRSCASLTILIVTSECGVCEGGRKLRVELESAEWVSSQRQRRFLCQRVFWCLYV